MRSKNIDRKEERSLDKVIITAVFGYEVRYF